MYQTIKTIIGIFEKTNNKCHKCHYTTLGEFGCKYNVNYCVDCCKCSVHKDGN